MSAQSPTPLEPVEERKHTGSPPRYQETAPRCHLFELPAELRNDIWELIVVEASTITVGTAKEADGRNADLRRMPGITQACQQSREETLPIFLGQNTFQFHPFYLFKGRPKERHFGLLRLHVTSIRAFEFLHCGEIDDESEACCSCRIRLDLNKDWTDWSFPESEDPCGGCKEGIIAIWNYFLHAEKVNVGGKIQSGNIIGASKLIWDRLGEAWENYEWADYTGLKQYYG